MSILRDAINTLTAAEEFLNELGPLEDAHDKAAAELTLVESSLAETKKELADAKAGLALVHIKNLRDYEETVFNKAQQSKDLDGKIAEQQSQLDTLRVEVAASAAQHKQIEDSINSLRKKIG
jgi:phage shock protein A